MELNSYWIDWIFMYFELPDFVGWEINLKAGKCWCQLLSVVLETILMIKLLIINEWIWHLEHNEWNIYDGDLMTLSFQLKFFINFHSNLSQITNVWTMPPSKKVHSTMQIHFWWDFQSLELKVQAFLKLIFMKSDLERSNLINLPRLQFICNLQIV